MTRNLIIGKFGEKLAKNYLLKHNYKIIDTNIQVGHKEIDILAKISDIKVFFEVKTRISTDDHLADESLGARKLDRLKKAVGLYVDNNNLDPARFRLDLLAVNINKDTKIAKIRHYKDIF